MGKKELGKGKISLTFALALFLFLLFFNLSKAQWENATIQRLTFDSLPDWGPSLFIDENDKLHLFYQEGTETTVPPRYWLVYITKEKGGDWSEPESIKYFDFWYKNCVVYNSKSNTIHLVYYDYWAPTGKLYYTNSKMNWIPTLADSIPSDRQDVSMNIDSFGDVHLIWRGGYPGDTIGYAKNKVIYATNSTGEWVIQEVSSGGINDYPCLAVEKNGRAHILYLISRYLCHVYNNTPGGTLWHRDSLDVYKYGRPTQFVLDKENHLHMVSSEIVNPWFSDSCRLYYSYRTNTVEDWQEPAEIDKRGLGNGLLVDQKLNVHISWSSVSGNIILSDVHYGKKEAGTWTFFDLLYDSLAPHSFDFVMDSEGKGHGIFEGYMDLSYPLKRWKLEIYYLGESMGTFSPKKTVKFELSQNYPNPFNFSTAIPFTIYGSQSIANSPVPTTLKIYNILGQEVRTLANEGKTPGQYKVFWDGKDGKGTEVSSGVYFYVLKSNDFQQVRKLTLIK